MFYNEMENNQQTQKDNKENKRKVSEGRRERPLDLE
jgi:hypothetical protein